MNKNRKTSHILNVFQYDETTGAVTLPSTLVLTAPASNDNSTKVSTTAWVRTYVSGLSYLTGNQSITVSGDATGSGTTAITLTLANTAVTPGTYGSTTLVPVVTVDSKGRITSVTTAAISGSLTFTGDVTGSGTTGTSTGLTLAASGVTAGTYTKVTVDSKGRVTVGANASTTDISEGTNLYYTDTRVGTYLTANSYATQSYVGTQVANLVAAAPATLDTLNELAAALGNDPSFATTVSTSIGTKVPQTRTLTINGTGYDLSADRSWTINSMVYPGAGIALSTGTAWGTSITDNSANWNTAYGWGNHASGGYLTGITSGNVTTALGYTPYNSTNPSGYITSSGSISGTAAYATQWGTSSGYANFSSTAISASVGWLFGTTGNGTYAPVSLASVATLLSLGSLAYSSATIPTNNNQLTNGAGYITGVTNISGTAGSISGFNNPTTAATANTIVYRDASGDIYGRYIFGSYHNSSDNVDTGTITYIMAKFGDNYHRSATAAKVQAFLGLGSLAYSSATIPTNNNQLTNGAGYITSDSTKLPLAGGTMTGTITITNTDIRSNSTSNWTGEPGTQGKIQYHSNRWYIVSDSSSDRIVQFRRNGTDTSWIANDGTFNGSITGNAGTVTNGVYTTGDQTIGGVKNFSAYTGIGTGTSVSSIFTVKSSGAGYNAYLGIGGTTCFSVLPHNGSVYLSAGTYYEGTTWIYSQAAGSSLFNLTETAGVYWYSGTGASYSNVAGGLQLWDASGNWKNGVYSNKRMTLSGGDDSGTMYGPNATWGASLYVGASSNRNASGVAQVIATDGNLHLDSATNSKQIYLNYYNNAEIGAYGTLNLHSYNITNAASYGRSAAGAGYLTGGYGSIETVSTTGPIYCIGPSYVPTSTSTNTMYGVGYAYNGFTNAFGPANLWSFYVVGAGTVGVTLGSDGSGYFRADVIAYYSDRRLKTNIREIDNAIDKVMKLGGYYYNPNDLAVELKATNNQDERVGVMAQEVMEVLPHAVKDAPFDRTGTYKTVQYEKLVPLLIQAIKEQQTQIEELKTIINGITR